VEAPEFTGRWWHMIEMMHIDDVKNYEMSVLTSSFLLLIHEMGFLLPMDCHIKIRPGPEKMAEG
jgi:hypothetical protein